MSYTYKKLADREIFNCFLFSSEFNSGNLVRFLGTFTSLTRAFNATTTALGGIDRIERIHTEGWKKPRRPHYASVNDVFRNREVLTLKSEPRYVVIRKSKLNENL